MLTKAHFKVQQLIEDLQSDLRKNFEINIGKEGKTSRAVILHKIALRRHRNLNGHTVQCEQALHNTLPI